MAIMPAWICLGKLIVGDGRRNWEISYKAFLSVLKFMDNDFVLCLLPVSMSVYLKL